MKPLSYIFRQAAATAGLCARQQLRAGLAANLAAQAVHLCRFAVLVLLWKSLAAAGADLGGFTEATLLTYTFLSVLLRQPLDILSPATSSLWEGSVIGRYGRPMPVYASFISETIGRWWLPSLLCFAPPLLAAALLLGIPLAPAGLLHGLLFPASLLLSVIIGFGLDILFASVAIRMKNAMWMATRIREAVFSLLSGGLIPFALFPAPVAGVLSLLPFGSVSSAPLLLYTGTDAPARLLALQSFWAAAVWCVAHPAYKRAEGRMVSYGG